MASASASSSWDADHDIWVEIVKTWYAPGTNILNINHTTSRADWWEWAPAVAEMERTARDLSSKLAFSKSVPKHIDIFTEDMKFRSLQKELGPLPSSIYRHYLPKNLEEKAPQIPDRGEAYENARQRLTSEVKHYSAPFSNAEEGTLHVNRPMEEEDSDEKSTIDIAEVMEMLSDLKGTVRKIEEAIQKKKSK